MRMFSRLGWMMAAVFVVEWYWRVDPTVLSGIAAIIGTPWALMGAEQD